MQIGKYKVQMIDAGRYKLDGGAMFGVVPRTLWQKENPADEKNRIQMSLNTLLLVSAGRVILIDSGVGNKFSDKFKEIYDIDYSQTSLMKSLAEKNIQPEDVTDVILTHLHFDHVGGATHSDPDGQIRPQFPNANYYVQKKQLEWAQKGFPKDRTSYISENFEPLNGSGKLKILEGPQKLMEGVELILSEGHTVAQQMVKISGQSENLVYLADLIPMTAHLNLPWVMAYDLHPVQTIQEKEEILETAIKKEWLLFFEHDPRIHCGQVYKSEKGYQLKNSIKL